MPSIHASTPPIHARTLLTGLLSLWLALPASATGPASTDPAFPAVAPASTGVDPAALASLDRQVQALVDDDEILGGELLVIKDRHTLLRKAYGWKDREAGTRMPVNAVYCVRSMTKPLVGTAIQMLIDAGRLRLDTPVHTILPGFDGPRTRRITIEHLLEHMAGFPLTTMRRSLATYANLDEVADEAAHTELLSDPGSAFHYSDANADILGAVVEAVTHRSLEQFLAQRLLQPLAMHDTYTLPAPHDAVYARIPAAYSGGPGAWNKHWDPSEPPLFPLFLGSQGLYSTTTDYARFLALWMEGGTSHGQRLLSRAAIARGLKPRHPLHAGQVRSGRLVDYYGQLWMMRARTGAHGQAHTVMFGHDGSDGTHAWAWPDRHLMVLFFTQSRGTTAGVGIERSVEKLLVDPRRADAAHDATPTPATDPQSVAGLYWDQDVAQAYYVITPRGDSLMLDRPGRMHLLFKPDPGRERFVAAANPDVWIAFDSSQDGQVTGMRTFFGKRIEHDPRHPPAADLPSVAEVIARVGRAHHIERLRQVGPVRLGGTVHYVSRGSKGTISTLFDLQRSRTDMHIGGAQQTVMTDGTRAWSSGTAPGMHALEGRLRQQVLLDRLPVLLGDWRKHFRKVDVLKRIDLQGHPTLLVRAVPAVGPGMSLYVDQASGRLLGTDALVQIPGIGIIGMQTRMDDYREVDGMQIAFHTRTRFAHPLIGIVDTQLDKAETGVAVDPGTFVPGSVVAHGGE